MDDYTRCMCLHARVHHRNLTGGCVMQLCTCRDFVPHDRLPPKQIRCKKCGELNEV